MINTRPVIGFVVRFLAIFALFMIPWAGPSEGYASFLRGTCRVVYSSFGSDGVVHFFPSATLAASDIPDGYQLPDDSRGMDIHISLRSRRARGYQSLLHTNSWKFGFLPTVFVVSLILATPVPWSRKWRALLLGVPLISIVVVARFVPWFFYAFSQDNPVAIFAHDSVWRGVIVHLYKFLVVGIAGAYTPPLVVWVLVSFRRDDWKTLIVRPSRNRSEQR